MEYLLVNQKSQQKAMASHEHKIDHLDHPYYGPPIPPSSPAAGAGVYPARHDAYYALFCHAFRVLTLVLIALGVVVLVLWLVYQPSSLKAYVESAELGRFDLATANGSHHLLRYNLTVGFSIRNPNRKQVVLFRRLNAVALYGGEQLGYVDFSRTRQERNSTMEIRPSFHGQVAFAGGAAPAVALFGREKEEGFFSINVKLHTRVRLKVIVVNSVEYRPDVDCYIRVPDPSNATAVAQGFTPTQCHVDDFS